MFSSATPLVSGSARVTKAAMKRQKEAKKRKVPHRSKAEGWIICGGGGLVGGWRRRGLGWFGLV